ncbi:MAG: hypothetical protein KGV57_02615 [Fusobacterium sp.]|nr:hypothetical protein [Fusobacterium sp.]
MTAQIKIAIKLCLENEDYKTTKVLVSKIYKESEVEKFLRIHKEYIIVGGGVIKKENFNENLIKENYENLKDNLIVVSNEDEWNEFKTSINDLTAEKEEEQLEVNSNLKEIIKKYVKDEEQQKITFNCVKNSIGKTKKEILNNMDIVYISAGEHKGHMEEIFMAEPNIAITKNLYVVKDRMLQLESLKK